MVAFSVMMSDRPVHNYQNFNYLFASTPADDNDKVGYVCLF